jgi:hypothetical protein
MVAGWTLPSVGAQGAAAVKLSAGGEMRLEMVMEGKIFSIGVGIRMPVGSSSK